MAQIIALGVTSSSVLATLLLLALYYPVQPDDPALKKLIKTYGAVGKSKDRASGAAGSFAGDEGRSMGVEGLIELVGKSKETHTLVSFVERCSDVEPRAWDPTDGEQPVGDCLLIGFLQLQLQQLRAQSGRKQDVDKLFKTLLGMLRLGQPMLAPSRAMALLHINRVDRAVHPS